MTNFKGISRRRFLSAVGSAAAGSCIPIAEASLLAGESTAAHAVQTGRIGASREASASPPVMVENAGYRLLVDPTKGSIASFQSMFGVDRELLIPGHVQLPLFNIELMNDRHEFKTINSSQAKEISVVAKGDSTGQVLILEFKGIGDLLIDARVTVRCPSKESLTYWNLELSMSGVTPWITHVQFPVIEVPFDDITKNEKSHILSPFLDGILAGPVGPSMGTGWTQPRRNTPDVWRFNNYPGKGANVQLMAYYHDAGGLYIACDDATGLPKLLGPLMEDEGVTMAVGHYPAVRGPASTKLPYNVVLGTFHGDWYAAAEIYRDWASRQPFCSDKIAARKDMPKWIADSPIALAFPMRGQCDWDPPAAVNPEYTPATNALPYLEKLASGLESSLMPIVFNWEHAGPWVQPEAFPPLGGEESMSEFMAKSRAKGWHPAIYGDGANWVTIQRNTNYDGMQYFRDHGGEAAIARKWDGSPVLYSLGANGWRESFWTCVGTENSRQMILGMTRGMSEFGPDVIQQFDQGPGPVACYAPDHGHPPCPGSWQRDEFRRLLEKDTEVARTRNSMTAMSSEGAPPECFLQNFQTWDGRALVSNCPLFSFLYHEYANGFLGFYQNRVSDEALRASVARSLVTGYMLCFTLRDKGLIEYDWDQLWTRAIPDQAAIIDWAKRSNQFRAGIARDYLIFGRMLRPYKVNKVTHRDFGWGPEPLVQSATWKAQDGRVGTVLASYADLGETPQVELEGKGEKHLSLYIDGEHTERQVDLPCVLNIDMQPRSLCLIELS